MILLFPGDRTVDERPAAVRAAAQGRHCTVGFGRGPHNVFPLCVEIVSCVARRKDIPGSAPQQLLPAKPHLQIRSPSSILARGGLIDVRSGDGGWPGLHCSEGSSSQPFNAGVTRP
jgi:hypothetical protein